MKLKSKFLLVSVWKFCGQFLEGIIVIFKILAQFSWIFTVLVIGTPVLKNIVCKNFSFQSNYNYPVFSALHCSSRISD